jgi:hypothetical protein
MSDYRYRILYYTNQFLSILGENVKVGDGNARVFVYNNNDDVELRCNASYDEAILLLEVRKIKKF